jgi:hypothetical protein
MRSAIEELDDAIASIVKFREVFSNIQPIPTIDARIAEANKQASQSVLTQAEIDCLFGKDE